MIDIKKPSCFISYCREKSDVSLIKALYNEIKTLAPSRFEIYWDETNLAPGHSIPGYEDLISHCDIAIILLTPEYKRRIVQREDCGTYREYMKFVKRLDDHREVLQSGVSIPPFYFLPVIVSGSEETSVPIDIKGYKYIDFTSLRVHSNGKSGPRIIKSSKTKSLSDFNAIEAKFEGCLSQRKKDFFEYYQHYLTILFLRTKHEEVLHKYQEKIQKAFNANSSDDLLTSIFVKTNPYNKILTQEKCILVGRKGSGKSTIVLNFHRLDKQFYKEPIYIDINLFKLHIIYNFIQTKSHSSDVENILDYDDFFHSVWVIFICLECFKTLVYESDNGTNLVDASGYIPKLRGLKKLFRKNKFTQFTRVAEAVVAEVDRAIEEAEPTEGYYSQVVDNASRENIVRSVLGEKNLGIIKGYIDLCRRKFIFSLDGFDLEFDSFRKGYLALPDDSIEKVRMHDFEVSWLRGLLRTILDFRSGILPFSSKLEFCVSIPHDRYIEARETERDDFRYRDLATELQWSAPELALLVRKRLERLIDFESNKELDPLDRLEQVLRQDGYQLPNQISMRSGDNVISTSLFKYILRHTFWRPRDLLFILAAVLTTNRDLSRRKKKLSVEIIKDIISRTTFDIINTEFKKEYMKNIVNLDNVIQAFEGAKLLLDYNELSVILSKFVILTDGGTSSLDDNIDKINILFHIGFLGLDVGGKLRKQGAKGNEYFSFSDGVRIFESLDNERKRTERYCIHPIFTEYLLLDSKIPKVLLNYSDEYLERSELLNHY